MPTYFVRAQSGSPGSGTSRTIWAASTAYAIGDIVAPTTGYATAAARGYVYECTTAGTTGSTEPTWVYTTPDTSTTTSGTAVFTCRNPDTWAKAGMYLDQGLRRATATGDIVVIDKNNVPSTDKELAANITHYINADITIVSATQNGATGYTYAPMGYDTWIGNSTTQRNIDWSGGFQVVFCGLTFRLAGTTTGSITLRSITQGYDYEFIDLTIWISNTNNSSILITSVNHQAEEGYIKLVNPSLRFGSTGQTFTVGGNRLEIYGGSVNTAGSKPSYLFNTNSIAQADVRLVGFDCSHASNLVGSFVSGGGLVVFDRCRLPTGATILASQATICKNSGRVLILDSSDGDTHFHIGYYDSFGSLTCTSSIYANDGASFNSAGNKHSWIIATNSNVNATSPFVAPLLSRYFEEGNITPYIEILRTGTTTKYTNAEVWAEWHAKTTSGSTQANFSTNRPAIDATPSNLPDGIGTSNWTYGGGSAVSMRLQPPSQLSIAEIGAVSAQICCTVPSTTFYIDPQIRT